MSRSGLSFGSLFAGIGGIDLGLERAGLECRWQVEINPFCRRVLAARWPDVTRFGDVREIEQLESVDLVAGGFPCQPLSDVGLRKGVDDERWLWPEMARVVRMVRPRYVLVENVTGILRRGLGEVLGDMAELGYDAEWQIVSAAAIGALHRRDRVFILGYASGQFAQLLDACGLARAAADDREPSHSSNTSGGARGSERWDVEPDLDRVVNGLSARVDRARRQALGNAVVPQVAELIGRRIIIHEQA